ncbi:MAG TPA: hypothetical protein PK228_00585 [Saprospiraceae bacterium]|nr:hypothetical protein [Saprospiraceae bacterium]
MKTAKPAWATIAWAGFRRCGMNPDKKIFFKIFLSGFMPHLIPHLNKILMMSDLKAIKRPGKASPPGFEEQWSCGQQHIKFGKTLKKKVCNPWYR